MEGDPIVIFTDDGSNTLYSSISGENYHSRFGALCESNHIFINAGLEYYVDDKKISDCIHILEIGFGTGLNALLAYIFSQTKKVRINYTSYEPFPLSLSFIEKLNYAKLLGVKNEEFLALHNGSVNNQSSFFTILLNNTFFEKSVLPINMYDVVFFDAFSPEAQPELWTKNIFEKIYSSMRMCGVLTTYSCKGTVKRALKESGFVIEKLPGPPGKREFLRAIK